MKATSPAARPLLAATTAVLVCLLAGVAYAGVGDYACVDRSKVYHGNHRLFQRPCVVSADRVYNHIPAYREILRRGLTDKHAQYHLLMKKATAAFSAAVKTMVAARGHDLVAELGAVRKARPTVPDVPDRTDDVIKALD